MAVSASNQLRCGPIAVYIICYQLTVHYRGLVSARGKYIDGQGQDNAMEPLFMRKYRALRNKIVTMLRAN